MHQPAVLQCPLHGQGRALFPLVHPALEEKVPRCCALVIVPCSVRCPGRTAGGAALAAGESDASLKLPGDVQSGASWNTAVKPKALGAWNLHAAVEGVRTLEHFVCFSSIVGTMGNTGARSCLLLCTDPVTLPLLEHAHAGHLRCPAQQGLCACSTRRMLERLVAGLVVMTVPMTKEGLHVRALGAGVGQTSCRGVRGGC